MSDDKIFEQEKVYTYADVMKLPEQMRCERIDGVLYNMTPAPSPRHQEIVTQLSYEFVTYFRKTKKCKVFVSPIDVCLSANCSDPAKITEWVQPDLVVVCDKQKLDEQKITGTPDLIAEVLSPSTAKKDRKIKFCRYEKALIPQYWIIDPVHESVEVYVLKENEYRLKQVYFKDDVIKVDFFDGLEIDLGNIFGKEQ